MGSIVDEQVSFMPWLNHYELVVLRYGREHVVARAATRSGAENAAHSISQRSEINLSSMKLRRARGVHPANAAKACLLLIVLAFLLPWFWLKLVLGTIGMALMLGLLSSGFAWRRGGEDDR